MPDQVVVFRGRDGFEEWRVFFNGQLCSPAWRQRGPADIYLEQLRRGDRLPEYAA